MMCIVVQNVNPWMNEREMEKRYFTYQCEFISITCLSTGATRDPGHGTKIMRGEKGTFIS